MTKPQHIHKYKRLRYKSGNTIFFCALPDCNQKINISLVLGKRSICWRCGEPFIMNEYSLRLAKPHCDGCHKPKKNDSEETVPYTQVTAEENKSFAGFTRTEPSLAERLSQTIQNAQKQEEIEEEI